MNDLVSFLEAEVSALPASRNTKAYITGLFVDQAKSKRIVDYSKDSIVLAHYEVRRTPDLEKAQSIGDYVLWVLSWYPESVQGHREVVESIGRLSYYRCYRLVPSWRVYEECADNLPTFVRCLHRQTTRPL